MAIVAGKTPLSTQSPRPRDDLLPIRGYAPDAAVADCPMTRRAVLLILLALALSWLGYQTWSPHWLEQWTDRAAIRQCKRVGEGENLDLAQLHARRARCQAMEAAYSRKWD